MEMRDTEFDSKLFRHVHDKTPLLELSSYRTASLITHNFYIFFAPSDTRTRTVSVSQMNSDGDEVRVWSV